MKIFKVQVKNIACSQAKIQKILKRIRNKSYLTALKIIESNNTRLSTILYKTLSSAFFNIVSSFNEMFSTLFIKELFVTKNRILKKAFPRAKGKTDIKQKHFSNLNLSLSYL